MLFFRWLSDWAFTRIFWLCLLGSTAQADVILWGQGITGDPGNVPYIIKPGESRTQAFWIDKKFELQTLRLHVQDNPLSSGTGRVTVWLSGESIYSGPAVTTLTGLAKEMPGGWHYLTVTGLENQSQWVGSPGNLFSSEFKGQSAPGLNLQVRGVSLVPEPGAVVLLLVCCAAGIFYAWRGRRGDK